MYTETVPLKYGKLATKCPWIYTYFVQCNMTDSVVFSIIYMTLYLFKICCQLLLLSYSDATLSVDSLCKRNTGISVDFFWLVEKFNQRLSKNWIVVKPA